MPASISARALSVGGRSRSPASARTPGAPMSRRSSVHELPADECNAARMTRGASAAPRRYEELAS